MNYLIPAIDSRKIINPERSLFFCIAGERHNGHDYIEELYNKGVKNFVVEADVDSEQYPEASFQRVASTIEELQYRVAHHRSRFNIPIVAITGSNGKTIVKEWLSQMLEVRETVVKSPRSYNSQVGVPLSVAEIKPTHTIGIFEAGISQPGEMEKLQTVIQPTHGIITNIGSAHDEGFEDRKEKITEKLKLFKDTKQVVYHKKNNQLSELIELAELNTVSWSFDLDADYKVEYRDSKLNVFSVNNNLGYSFDNRTFTDKASLENLAHCVVWMLENGFKPEEIQSSIKSLRPISMRLEIKKGKNNCYVIDDSYNNDLAGLQTALDFLEQNKQRSKRTIILSDVYQTGLDDEALYQSINEMLVSRQIQRVILVGQRISNFRELFTSKDVITFKKTDDLLNSVLEFENETILVKGSRDFQFEKIVAKLIFQQHRTVMEIDLNALTNNLNFYRTFLESGTKVMVMVKAFGYGSGSFEVSNLLQFQKVDYLAVAYADEGVELRKNGIHIPILVMSPTEEDFQNILENNLEPEMYSNNILAKWITFINTKNQNSKIHIKVDSGMHRLGFESEDIEEMTRQIRYSATKIEIASIFSHLATADNLKEEQFAFEQIKRFKSISNDIESRLHIDCDKHILNSSGIVNFPEMQMDMVRLGIGLYGVDPTGKHQEKLDSVATLKSVISQIKTIEKGETIGYGRRGVAENDMTIATIAIGYADGLNRALGNGKGDVLINGNRAKIVGNVCMDMIMVDVTNIVCKEGEEVEVFGKSISITSLAEKLNTIPYEILTSVSERVKRVYYQE